MKLATGRIYLRRKRAPLQPPTPQPLAAVVLAIDAAKRSGLAWYVLGELAMYSEVDAYDPLARTAVLATAIAAASVRGVPLGVVIEVPFGGRVNAVLSLNATVKLWRDSWRAAGQPPGHMLDRTALEWRQRLFGRVKREQARRLEAVLAEQIAAYDMPGEAHRIGPDAAAAICLGKTMIRSRELQSALGCALR